jgi:hypothetical protein
VVEAGQLPLVEKRLPPEAMVVQVLRIGVYGDT